MTPSEILVIAGIVFGMLLVVAFVVPQNGSAQRSGQRTGQTPIAGSGYPLPPLDLVAPPRRAAGGTAVSGNGGREQRYAGD